MTTTLNRRQFMKLMAAAAAAGSVPAMYSARAFSQQSAPDGFYDAPMQVMHEFSTSLMFTVSCCCIFPGT